MLLAMSSDVWSSNMSGLDNVRSPVGHFIVRSTLCLFSSSDEVHLSTRIIMRPL